VPEPELPVVDSEQHQRALVDLHAWYKEWSETARALIKRRDFLVRLGLATRKPRKKTTTTKGEEK
jgi:hypothetical protein